MPDTTVTAHDRVPTWVRIGLVVLAIPQLATGLWAVISPSHWYEHFPGIDPRLVAADGAFNAHLASDAGGGFLATGVALAVAAIWANRGGTYLALAAYLAFAVPHFAYHAANASPGLTDGENVVNVVNLAVAAGFPLALLWGARRRTGARPRATT